MGEIIDRTKGSVNESVGRAKKAVGRSTWNARLYAEGAGQERRGRSQKIVGRLKGLFGWRI